MERKHIIEKAEPADYRIPKNIPETPKYRAIVADPPWTKNQAGTGKYGSAMQHYDLMTIQRIKDMPVADLVADNAYLFLWCMNSNVDEALEVIKAWGFRYAGLFVWVKPKLGLGHYFRNSTEPCIFAVRGRLPVKCRNQINWLISYPTKHSEKPREFISIVERMVDGPYLELFCRNRPASNQKWYCWGKETEGGSDLFIPGYPVKKYSFEKNSSDDAGAREDDSPIKSNVKEEV